MLLFVGSALATGIAITALPVLLRYSYVMAWSLVALAVAAFCLQVVDNGRILSMLSLSQEYARSGASKAEIFQALALVAGPARKWSHYTYLLVAVSWIALLFSMLYRFRLVPRLLALLGLITSLLQIAGVSLRVIMGSPPQTQLAMPLAPCYRGLALWLLFKGLQNPVRYQSLTGRKPRSAAEIERQNASHSGTHARDVGSASQCGLRFYQQPGVEVAISTFLIVTIAAKTRFGLDATSRKAPVGVRGVVCEERKSHSSHLG
jgi:uncharacterized protein DUF4386